MQPSPALVLASRSFTPPLEPFAAPRVKVHLASAFVWKVAGSFANVALYEPMTLTLLIVTT